MEPQAMVEEEDRQTKESPLPKKPNRLRKAA
jgi:hypothetical protein